MEPYAWRRIYTFCIRQPTSQHPVGSSLVIPKSPQIHMFFYLPFCVPCVFLLPASQQYTCTNFLLDIFFLWPMAQSAPAVEVVLAFRGPCPRAWHCKGARLIANKIIKDVLVIHSNTCNLTRVTQLHIIVCVCVCVCLMAVTDYWTQVQADPCNHSENPGKEKCLRQKSCKTIREERKKERWKGRKEEKKEGRKKERKKKKRRKTPE